MPIGSQQFGVGITVSSPNLGIRMFEPIAIAYLKNDSGCRYCIQECTRGRGLTAMVGGKDDTSERNKPSDRLAISSRSCAAWMPPVSNTEPAAEVIFKTQLFELLLALPVDLASAPGCSRSNLTSPHRQPLPRVHASMGTWRAVAYSSRASFDEIELTRRSTLRLRNTLMAPPE